LEAESFSAPAAQPKKAPAEVARAMPAPGAAAGSVFSGAPKLMAKAPVAVGELPKTEQSAHMEIAEEKPEPASAANSASLQAEAPSTVQAQNAPADVVHEMAAPGVAGGSALSGTATMMARAKQTNQISSPDGSVAWQYGIGGAIMRSMNSGPWLAQSSGVTTDLLAASAPSNDVCWMVGKSGTIVRTLDSGAHWQLVRPPSRDNFTAITATDSNNASVVAADGERFTTDDGGVTWSSP